ncbi:non-ribosomal peptide synthetase [Catellatospora tritici]|uniref:non-ribosomal peptide synthetase n=1 Tax=Catellatospora tritici TaxID=2851566 RepID=UPI001C2DE20C|nr:AMP-binding protein [Catellatospora tritici]MBV1850752.1 AMP-binding protein [Catellatospora tritici]MBV1851005.1 AMP-binding protein [Catellatospora tritici]
MNGYDEFPASAQQRAMWFVESLTPGTARHHVPAAMDLSGPLDAAALHRALRAVVARHEALRTGFATVAGQPVQRVFGAVDVDLPVRDVASAAEADLAEADVAVAPFDLAGPSLLRAELLRLGPTEHRLVVVAHHLVCDAWSSALVLRDLAIAYRGRQLPPGPIEYADYAVWQREQLTPDVVAGHLDHWGAVLRPLPEPVALPVDRPRPPVRGGTGDTRTARIPARTPFPVLLAALAGAVYRLTGQSDLAFGVVAAQRDRAELAEMVGFLVNTVPVRIRPAGARPLRELREQAAKALVDALDHRDLPFDRLVEALRPPRDPARLPLVDILVTHTADGLPELDLPGLSARVRRLPTGLAKADLTVEAAAGDVHLEFDRDVLGPDTADWLVRAVTTLVAAPDEQPLSEVDLLFPGQAKALSAYDDGPAVTATPATMPQRFAAVVAAHADAPAVEADDGTRTYAQLADEVHRCAAALVRAGVRPGDRVGVRAARSVSWPVLMLAAMYAGAAPVPLDPGYPAARLEAMTTAAAAAMVLDAPLDAEPLPLPSVTPDDLAYVIFTSGSTGQPKGVAVEHASLVRLADHTIARFGLGPGDRVLQFATPSFDAAMWDLVLALLSGATLCLAAAPALLPGPVLRATLRDRRISYVLVPPSALALVPADEPLPDLRVLVSGGEACPAELVRRWAPGRRFFNAYGPTENTVVATLWEAAPGQPVTQPPLGEPLPGVGVHLLDEAMRPVPPGVPGEIFLSGAALARGYIGRDDLTAAAFTTGPGGRRCYRTGDLAVRDGAGRLRFTGRRDGQVKIRGFRVEPAEAEHALRAQPEVTAAAVVARTGPVGTELVGYYVAAGVPGPAPDGLRAALARTLPGYLVPAHLVAVPALPVTAGGKLDRAALPDPVVPVRSRPPRPGLEQTVAAAWCEALGLAEVGAEDNFFDVGGHSLALARVHARLCVDLGRDLAVVDLFRHPTVAALAAHLSGPDTVAAAAADGRDRAAQRRAAQQLRRPTGGGGR